MDAIERLLAQPAGGPMHGIERAAPVRASSAS